MKSKPDIVPVQLSGNVQNQRQNETRTISSEPTCRVKSGNLEITLHNGVDRYLLHTVLGLIKDAR